MEKLLDNLNFDSDIIEELKNQLESETDFTIDIDGTECRFIKDSVIDSVMQDELSSDKYVLGCFNSWFLADILGIPESAVEAMQKAEAFEALGEMVISMDKLEGLQGKYVSADGYGHHFNHNDFSEDEVSYNGELWHVFKM